MRKSRTMQKLNLKRFCLMLDCSRNAVMNIENLKSWVDICELLGFTSLMLYTEDTYEIDGHPYFGYARGRYTKNELKEIDSYAVSRGIEIIPFIQTLAHIEQIFRWKDYAPLNDCDDILLCDDERVYSLIDAMFTTLEECFTTRMVNVGMDEAHHIGRGRYYDLHGECEHSNILLKHAHRVADIAKNHGFQICMWSDMFFNFATGSKGYFNPTAEVDESVGALIPDNASLIYWDYYKRRTEDYSAMLRLHDKIKDGCWYAGGVWTWDGFATQNTYSIEALKSSLEGCRECGVENVIITTWGDGGAECSVYEALPALFFASEYVKGTRDTDEIKRRFKELFRIEFDDFMLFDQVMRRELDSFYLSPSKYLLYNDPLIGLLDTTVPDSAGDDFAEITALTEPLIYHEKWGYLFETNHRLSKAVSKKCDVGIRIRKAYRSNDTSALKELADELMEIKELVYEFYLAFRRQWMRENKPYGFEVHDARLGGLMTRIIHCAERLDMYVNGKISSIEELEDEPLDVRGDIDRLQYPKSYVRYNKWQEIITASNLAINR